MARPFSLNPKVGKLRILCDPSTLAILHTPDNLDRFVRHVVFENNVDLTRLDKCDPSDAISVQEEMAKALRESVASTGLPIDVEVRVSVRNSLVVLHFSSQEARLALWDPEQPTFH